MRAWTVLLFIVSLPSWGNDIEAARKHPFQFAPFAAITDRDVDVVLAHATEKIASYRAEVWPATPATSRVRQALGRVWGGRPQPQVA